MSRPALSGLTPVEVARLVARHGAPPPPARAIELQRRVEELEREVVALRCAVRDLREVAVSLVESIEREGPGRTTTPGPPAG
jgi:hypothetical protein